MSETPYFREEHGRPIYALLAEFDSAEAVLAAAEAAYQAGYRRIDAYTPFPVEGLSEALGHRSSLLPLVVLGGGITGALVGYGMQYYAMVISYPLNVGGRPLHSWPSFIPITFELAILFAGFAAVLGMFALNGLPQPYHPVFNVPNFELATRSHFFLAIEKADPLFELEETRKFLEGLGANMISEASV
jgi:hypothetical protein